MVDALASEYGWEPDRILDLPCDVTTQLTHAILHRKGVKVWRANSPQVESAPNLQSRLDSIFGKIDTVS